MHSPSFVPVLLSTLPCINAVSKGFNYGSTLADGSCALLADYTSMFTRSHNLVDAPGFTSARLYTNIQCGTTNSPSEAFEAAINTKTTLLLGLWASSGDATIDDEIAAMTSAASTYGTSFKDIIVGISVGSEDLYRDSVQGAENNAGVGAGPATIVDYVSQVRSAISGTVLEGIPIGHVDTWTAWVNASNSAVITAVDWIGHDEYPYFETTHANSISVGKADFDSALAQTEAVAGSKPVWVCETGWPWAGPTEYQAVASIANAKTYWDEVGCGELFGQRNTWWYTLFSSDTAQSDLSFNVVYPTMAQGQVFELACPA